MVSRARTRWPLTLIVFGMALFCGCSLPGRDETPAPTAPPMIGAAEAEDAKPVRRQKIRFAWEISNSQARKKFARRSEGAKAETLRIDPFAQASSNQALASPDGTPYPHTTPPTAIAPSPVPSSPTQRLPDVGQVAFAGGAPY